MTERGLPIPDSASACPFVAFEEDRDGRATAPDRRHRCYAEVRPAPRALAHQEAYCLATAFPICPTFQDWARREAAQARHDEVAAPGPEDAPHRNPRRDWAEPPPWLTGRAGRPSGSAADEDGDEESDEDVAPLPPQGAGLSGGFAERLLGGADATRGGGQEQFAWSAGTEEDEADAVAIEAEPGDASADRRSAAIGRGRDRDLARDQGSGRGPDRRPTVSSGRPSRETEAPSWERPRRFEAYPTLRSRRLPSLALPGSPVLLGVAAVVVAAVALFFLPALLGIGNKPGPTATGTPAPSASAGATTAAEPTPSVAPTGQIYVVQQGDLMSKIATRFGVPLQVLIDANKDTIPNPDKIKPGDQVIIPGVAPTTIPGASGAAASPTPS